MSKSNWQCNNNKNDMMWSCGRIQITRTKCGEYRVWDSGVYTEIGRYPTLNDAKLVAHNYVWGII